MSCILSITGAEFDIDGFIAATNLQPYKTVYKGQPMFDSNPTGEKVKYSSLSIETSKADFNSLDQQIKETIEYLKVNYEKLQHILNVKEIQYADLDFGVNYAMNQFSVSSFFPNELLRLAADLGLGIEVSVYAE